MGFVLVKLQFHRLTRLKMQATSCINQNLKFEKGEKKEDLFQVSTILLTHQGGEQFRDANLPIVCGLIGKCADTCVVHPS